MMKINRVMLAKKKLRKTTTERKLPLGVIAAKKKAFAILQVYPNHRKRKRTPKSKCCKMYT